MTSARGAHLWATSRPRPQHADDSEMELKRASDASQSPMQAKMHRRRDASDRSGVYRRRPDRGLSHIAQLWTRYNDEDADTIEASRVDDE